MNLLAAKLYDPAVAVSKATSALLAMTAFDTANLRLAITVPAHGMVRFRLRCVITGAVTVPTILLGCLNGATVIGRVTPLYGPFTANVATQDFHCDAEFTVTGLAPGAMNVDAAYAVQVVVAATNIKYSIAAQVLASAAAAPIAADMKKVNAVAVAGDGAGTPWGP